MQIVGIYRLAASALDMEVARLLNQHLNKRLRPTKRLPFVIYFDIESSGPDKLVFRVEHRTGLTSNKVYVTRTDRRGRTKHGLHIDASDGSNWHHLKSQFVEWFRNALSVDVPMPEEVEVTCA